MNETAKIAVLLWVWHLGFALVPSLPVIWLGRRRVAWRRIELLVFVLPFAIWFGLMLSPISLGRKTLANLGEPLFFAITIPIAVLLRVVIGRRFSERVCSRLLITAVCLVAVGVFLFTPALPE